MTLLDRCAGGSILEKPKPVEVEVNSDDAADLRERILDGCLPAQRDFVTDTRTASRVTSEALAVENRMPLPAS